MACETNVGNELTQFVLYGHGGVGSLLQLARLCGAVAIWDNHVCYCHFATDTCMREYTFIIAINLS